jgi:hypothetical protein
MEAITEAAARSEQGSVHDTEQGPESRIHYNTEFCAENSSEFKDQLGAEFNAELCADADAELCADADPDAGSDAEPDSEPSAKFGEEHIAELNAELNGYVSFPLLYNGGITGIVKIKKLDSGYNLRVYIERQDVVSGYKDDLSRQDWLTYMDKDPIKMEFHFQFDAERVFIGIDNGCDCGNDEDCENRSENQCKGAVTDEEFEEYRRTDITHKDKHDIGNTILAHVYEDTYIAINASMDGTNSDQNRYIYIFYPEHEIVGYCSHVGNSAVPYPYAVDSANNYYLMIDGFAFIRAKDKSVICNPYRAYYDRDRTKYNINKFIGDFIFLEGNKVDSSRTFVSGDPSFTDTLGDLGMKSAAKLS